jgi:hypothetical protein
MECVLSVQVLAALAPGIDKLTAYRWRKRLARLSLLSQHSKQHLL